MLLLAPLPLTSGIEFVSLQLSNLIDNMTETASAMIEGWLKRSTLPKMAVIIFQIICFIGIISPSSS
jgi:hypothetical protein